MAEIPRENNFRSEKAFLMIKSDFIIIKYELNLGGKHWNAMDSSIIKDELYDVISLKIKQ